MTPTEVILELTKAKTIITKVLDKLDEQGNQPIDKLIEAENILNKFIRQLRSLKMNNFTTNQTFTLTTDDNQILTYRIQTITSDGRLLVHSSLLEQSYFVSQQAFRDFLRVIGVQLDDEYQAGMEQYILAKVEGSYP